jgi:PAS domain S-box-containing protein
VLSKHRNTTAFVAQPKLLAALATALAVAFAVALQFALAARPGTTNEPHLVLFIGAAVAAAWAGGLRAGLWSTVLGALALAYLFIEPRYSPRIERTQDLVLLLAFIAAGVLGSWLCRGSRAAAAPGLPAAQGDRPLALHLVVFTAAYVLAGGLGQGLHLIPEVAITFWPPAGIFVAALLLNPRAHWRWYVAAGGLAELACNDLWFHNPLPFALVYFAANALEALAAAWLLGRFAARPFQLDSPGQVAAFVGLAAGLAPVVGATVIATTDALIGKHPFTAAWPLVWLGDATGLLVSMPLALALGQGWRARRRVAGRRLLEAGAVAAFLVGVEALALRDLLPTVYMTMPLVLWAAVRFQLHGAAVAVALVTITAGAFTVMGAGEFAGPAEQLHTKAILLQTFLAVTAVSALLAAGLSHRLQQAKGTLETVNRDLEHRVQERTAALDRERARLDIALRTGRTGIYEWNLVDGSVWWSAETYPLYGVEPGSIALTPDAFLALVHPDDRDELMRKTEACVARHEVFEHEYRVVLPDGALRWVYNRSRVELGPDGQPALVTGVATDITDRKQADEALRDSEARLRGILRQSPVGIVQTDAAGCMTLVNQRWCDMLGYSEAELLGRNVLDITHGSSVGPTAEAVGRLAAGGPDFQLEKVYRRRDGSPLHAQSNVTAVRAPTGEFLGLIAVVMDLSERLRIERELREREHFLQRITEVTPGVLNVFDLEARRAVYINRSVASLLGFEPEQVQAMGEEVTPNLMHPDDLVRFERHLAHIRTLGDGEVADFEHRMRDRAGEWHWFHSHDAVFARDATGAARQLIGLATEITARKQAEMAVARLAAIVESSADGLFSEDLDGMVTAWNPGAERIFGYRADEIVGTSIMRLVPEGAQAAERALQREVFAGAHSKHFETLRLARDGRQFPASVTVSPLKDGAGKVVGTSRVVRDITERKQAEETLARQATALADADRHKDTFLATLAHELRNPLATIHANVQLLRRKTDDRVVAEQSCARMERQVMVLVRLIDDLMDVSRISQDKLTLRVEPLDLVAVVKAGLESSQPSRDQRGHAVTLTLPPQPMTMEGDATRLAQVVSNLLTNAAKYSDPVSPISLTLERQGNEAMLSVRDQGIGIAPSDLPQLFKMFEQVGHASHLTQGGLGIGLHLVKRLVELHGGSVQAHSEGRGRGSEFVVRLPLERSARQQPARSPEVGQLAPSRRRRILVADDNEDALGSLALLLEHGGHDVRTAGDGAQAWALAASFEPDVVLLDLRMPQLDGYEACRRIRALPRGATMVLVALTGWGQDEDRRRTREAGFDHHFVKPVSPAALESLLQSLAPPA